MTGRVSLAGVGLEWKLPSRARQVGFEVFMSRVGVAKKHSSTPRCLIRLREDGRDGLPSSMTLVAASFGSWF